MDDYANDRESAGYQMPKWKIEQDVKKSLDAPVEDDEDGEGSAEKPAPTIVLRIGPDLEDE